MRGASWHSPCCWVSALHRYLRNTLLSPKHSRCKPVTSPHPAAPGCSRDTLRGTAVEHREQDYPQCLSQCHPACCVALSRLLASLNHSLFNLPSELDRDAVAGASALSVEVYPVLQPSSRQLLPVPARSQKSHQAPKSRAWEWSPLSTLPSDPPAALLLYLSAAG